MVATGFRMYLCYMLAAPFLPALTWVTLLFEAFMAHLSNARIIFDKFHIIGHPSTAIDKMRRIEQRGDRSLNGMRWTLLRDTAKFKPVASRQELPGRC